MSATLVFLGKEGACVLKWSSFAEISSRAARISFGKGIGVEDRIGCCVVGWRYGGIITESMAL